MDASELREGIEADYETELSRLGSSKAIYAVTGGEMEGDVVLDAMADRAYAAGESFDRWAADATDAVLSDTFGAIAEQQREHADKLVEAGGDGVTDDPTPLETYLRGLDSPVERAGGLLAWALVTDQTLSQAVGFFVGNADPSSANVFRDLRSEVEDEIDRIESLLEEVCADDADWETAGGTASEAIEAAYDHYVETLEGLGVKVKPVC